MTKKAQSKPPRRSVGILVRTALLSWLVAMVTLGIFIAVVVPSQRAAFLANLESKAHGVTASLQDIAAGAAISDDYSTIVDHCTRILAEDESIEYLVLTRKDGFSLIHERQGWRSDQLGDFWLPADRVARGAILRPKPDQRELYHYSRPFDYSGIQWGWIHAGLSLRAYNENVRALYHRTSLAVFICLFLGLVASMLYARAITQPIMELREAVLKLAGGDLSVRASVAARDEVGELGESFNAMTESLLQRDRILQSVRFAAQQFLSAEDWRAVIDEVLASLGRSADASHVAVSVVRDGQDGTMVCSLEHEWTAAHARANLSDSRWKHFSLRPDGLTKRVAALEMGGQIVGRRSELPEHEHQFLAGLGIEAFVLVPIWVGGRWWGNLWLDDCRSERTWSEAVVTSLRAAADTLGAAEERHQARTALLLAKDAAEGASRAKSQFLANMSHEIRTPITGVMGMLHLLQRTELTTKQEHYVSNASNAAGALLTVIGDVLDFSKIEAGRMELEESDFFVPDILDSAVRIFAERAEAKGIELAYRLGESVPRVLRGDPDRLRQVLVNLIGNALKFTERGEILVDCRLQEGVFDGEVLRFFVRDSGCGIAPEQQEMVFDAFSQADGSMSRLHGGTGLGLAICRQLCELMGGEIGLESEPGRGSTFWFTVRLKRPLAEMAGVQPAPRSLKGLRVLVVDDCDTTLDILREYVLSWKGYPEVASDAVAALEMLRAAAREGRPFRVAVLDWRMPGMNGIALARRIRADADLRKTGLVLLSSFTQFTEGPGEGALFAARLPKPARMSELYDAVVTAANGHVQRPGVSGSTPMATKQTPERPRGEGVVLLVEDNEINREVAGEMITELGYRCIFACNGREAVDAVEAGRADLVLMDCQMPIMDGYEATRLIRRWERRGAEHSPTTPSRPGLPVIALTAHAMKGDRDVCLNAGMDDFLTKPLDPDELARTLAKWMRRRQAAPEAPAVDTAAGDAVAPATEELTAVAGSDGGSETEYSAHEPPMDFPELVQRCMGKADLAERLLRKFLPLVGPYAEEIVKAVESGDASAVEQAAHRLKGSAANVSAKAVRRIAAELEEAGERGDLTGAPALLAELLAEVERLRTAYEEDGRRAA